MRVALRDIATGVLVHAVPQSIPRPDVRPAESGGYDCRSPRMFHYRVVNRKGAAAGKCRRVDMLAALVSGHCVGGGPARLGQFGLKLPQLLEKARSTE